MVIVFRIACWALFAVLFWVASLMNDPALWVICVLLCILLMGACFGR